MGRTGPAAGFFSLRATNSWSQVWAAASAPFETCAVWQRRNVRCRNSP